MKRRYPVDWKSTRVHPVLIALDKELNGRRLHPTLIRAFESRSDIIADHVSSIRHIPGEVHGSRKGLKSRLKGAFQRDMELLFRRVGRPSKFNSTSLNLRRGLSIACRPGNRIRSFAVLSHVSYQLPCLRCDLVGFGRSPPGGRPVLLAFASPKCGMDKAGLAFLALIVVLIAIVMSILVVDRTPVDVPPNRPGFVPTNQVVLWNAKRPHCIAAIGGGRAGTTRPLGGLLEHGS